MALPTPAPGLVIWYAYLWRDQGAAGAEEGRKNRPCGIVLTALDDEVDTVVYVAPITLRRRRATTQPCHCPQA